MALGNEDTELEVSEIVRNTVTHLSFDGNGNTDVGGNNITGIAIAAGTNGSFDFTGSHNILESRVSGADIRFVDSNFNDIIRAVESNSNVQIPSGDLTDGTNVIYDQSASHIPSARVEQAGLDADTVDGFEAADLRNSSNVAQFTSTNTTTDINQSTWTDIPFDVQQILDGAFTHDASGSPEQITFDEAGRYRVEVALSFDGDGTDRQNPEIKLNLNGTRLDTSGLHGYIRAADGHYEASNGLGRVIDVAAGDTLRVQTIKEAAGGTVTLRSQESILTIEQLSASSAPISDAETLDGLDSTAFVKTDGSTPITSTQAITQTNGHVYIDFNNTSTGDTWDTSVYSSDNFALRLNTNDVFNVDNNLRQVTFSERVIGSSGFDAGGASVDNVTEANTTGSGSASFNVFDSANSQDIARFNEGGDVVIPNGTLDMANNNVEGINRLVINDAGINEGLTFPGFQIYEEVGGDLVIRDETNDVDLIRQPASGPTQFIQGADIGSIEAPEDSFTQVINSANTTATASGDTVGYTFAVDNQSLLSVEAASDGTGGVSDKWVEVQDDLRAEGGEVIWDESASEIPDAAMGSIDNTTLTNDSITVTAGDGLKNGGTVALGASTTLDVEPADFAGAGLSDDGADNLALTNDTVTIAGNAVTLGGSTTPDASDLSGAAGTNGQFLQTDGTNTTWSSVTTDITIEDDTTTILSTNNINFGTDLTVVDDGDGTATINANAGAGNLSELTIDADKDWQNFDIFNVRKMSAEDGVINGKTLETGESMTIANDESMVVSESYTVNGDLTIEGSGSLTVM